MIDRGKVIKGLESLRDICNAKSNMAIGKGKVAWAGYANTVIDAIELLKEQEAKCLTKAELDDLNENQFVWIEGRAGIYLYCLQIIGICRERTGVSDIQFNTPTCYVERSTDTYGKDYRIWTDKPTEEQRQVVKWNEID